MKTMVAPLTGADRGMSGDVSGAQDLNAAIGAEAKLSNPEVKITRTRGGADTFAIEVDGTFNHMDFELRSGVIDVYHTEVDKSQQGKGFGKMLAEAAIAYAEEHGLRLIPTCPFMADYMRLRGGSVDAKNSYADTY